MEGNKIINLESLKYYNDKIVKYISDFAINPFIYSDPNLDFESTTNNSNCYGYVGSLKNINVKGDLILIDSIAAYVREGNASPHLNDPVWCRLLKFVDGADGAVGTWEIVYQSTESKTIGSVAPEALFSFKMKAINEQNKLIKSTDKIAIVYVDNENAEVLSGIQLGFKAIINIGGGLQSQLTNNSTGVSNWAPAFVIGYLSMADDLKNVVTIEDNQTVLGVKNFASHIGIDGKSYIKSNIDQGELKVCHPGVDDGFIVRTSGDKNVGNVYQLQLLTTNGSSSYQYNFPKQNGDVVVYKELSYRELRNLKNNSQLIPGGVYRITDYMTYTSTYNTASGSHQFDILVVALSKNELSENAKACLHNGDTYFSSRSAKLESWEIKYCLDNDAGRFAWINGSDSEYKGVIYYMKDEWGNEAPYDFKNILFKKNGVNYYTFSLLNNDNIEDATVTTKNVYNNKILPLYDLGDKNMILSHNVFLLTNNQHLCESNYIGQNCKNNMFGSYCTCNTLESYCDNNTFGDYCQYNELDNYCQSNIFGDYCQSNVFGVNCTENKFGSYILRCNIGNKCSYCKITNSSGDNGSLLSYVKMIEFGDECSNVNLWTDNTDSGYIQNYKITNGISGSIKITGDNIRGRNYQTIISKNVHGDIEQFILSATNDAADTTMKNILYSDLKDLRDNNKLIPGQKYRITDYVTTTTQEETKSANHPFDVIVLALSENTLSEDAKAILHEGDTYFADSDLSAWEIKYCLDNDDSRFAWADITNGKGVIYRMVDEKRNDCPYDFKNILFYNTTLTSDTTSDKYYYTFSYIVSGVLYDGTTEKQAIYCYDNIMGEYRDAGTLLLNKNVFRNIDFENYCHSNKFGNCCHSNKFGNCCHDNTFGNECYQNTFGDECFLNVFWDACYDNIFGSLCSFNKFGYCCDTNTFGGGCDNNTFGNYYYSNVFGDDCGDNTFGDNCGNNTFGSYCRSNTFGHICNHNTLGDDCGYNNFGSLCGFNKFGDNCNSNTFGESCDTNELGDRCNSNTFGDNCGYNNFGGYCDSNTFGDNCDSNTFGDNCNSNTFGDNCGHNNFGEFCNHNTFGDNCSSDKFGDHCGYNTFGNKCESNNFGNKCESNNFGVFCSFNTFGDECKSNAFKISCSYNTFKNKCESNNFRNYCESNNFEDNCSNNNFGDNCSNNTFGESCVSNTFGYHCHSNTFGCICNYNNFGDYCSSNNFEDNCSNNNFGDNLQNRSLNSGKTSITLNEGFYDDGSGQLVPIKHPDLSTQPSILPYKFSILPYKFMGQYIYEQLIPTSEILINGSSAYIPTSLIEGNFILDCCVVGTYGAAHVLLTRYDSNWHLSHDKIVGASFTQFNYIKIVYTSMPEEGDYYGLTYARSSNNSSIDSGVMEDGTSYTYDNNTNTLTLSKNGVIDSTSVPAQYKNSTSKLIIDNNVTSIGFGTFGNYTGLTSVTIPNSVTSIGSEAFSNCSSLTSIEIPNSVTGISSSAFSGCTGLTSIIVASDNPKYDSREGCNAIIDTSSNKLIVGCKTTVIPNNVTSIGSSAFGGCTSLTSIVIPNSVTNISSSAFSGCTGLTSIIVASDNPKYDSREGCNAIIDTSSNKLIVGCKTTVIPNNVTSIGSSAFGGCTSLTSIVIPNSVTSIGDWAFSNCSGLASVVISNSMTSIGQGIFQYCSSLTSVTIPDSVTSIGDSAFAYCTGLTSVTIPDSVTSISGSAFVKCSSLTSVTIPDSVTSIDGSAFAYCTGLTSITCYATNPPSANYYAFNGVSKSIPLYVPAGSVSSYKSAICWKEFTNIQAINS